MILRHNYPVFKRIRPPALSPLQIVPIVAVSGPDQEQATTTVRLSQPFQKPSSRTFPEPDKPVALKLNLSWQKTSEAGSVEEEGENQGCPQPSELQLGHLVETRLRYAPLAKQPVLRIDRHIAEGL